MGSRRSDDNNFIVQAGILAAAGIISRMIGLLYRSPLNSVIGELGLGYYQAAYGFYTIVLLISSYSIPSAISKVIAQKIALKEYRNAHRIFKCALAYVLVVGGVAGLFLFFAAGLFVSEEAVPVLRTFAPTIFVYGILGVLRGYFQAHKSMVQTSVSQILEQIANAVVSVGAACLFIYIGFGTLQEPAAEADRISRATYGAIGSAIGTGSGVLVGLLFMLGVYFLNRKLIRRRIARDPHTNEDSYGSIIKTITFVVTPFILSTAIYNLSAPVNNAIYTKILPQIRNIDTVRSYSNYAVFSGQALTVSNIPIAFATAMAAAMIPSIAQLMASGDLEQARKKIALSVKSTMVISIPAAVGLFALAKPVMFLFFPRSEEVVTLAGQLLQTLSLSVIFYALSTLGNSILQGLGKVNVPIINSAIALVVQTVTAIVLLHYTNLDLHSLAIANTLYGFIMCVLNQWAVRRAAGYRQEVRNTFLMPLLASLIMGAAAYGVYGGLFYLLRSMRLALIPAVIVGVIVYAVSLLLLKGITEEEIRTFPKGHLLVKIAKKMKLL